MEAAPVLLEGIGADGWGLRVAFHWLGDRYGHTISLIEPRGAVVPLLESIEGPVTDDWPSSPPLQSLHVQELPAGRRAALLVGMAGRNHWSASVEAAPGQPALVFDVACRRSAPSRLPGSKYRLLAGPLTRTQDDDQRVVLALSEGRRIQVIASNESLGTAWSDQELWIGVVPHSGAVRTTERWRYEIAVLSTEY